MTKISLPALSSDNGLSSYITKVSGFPYLSQEEEYMLAKRWSESDDITAAQSLVTSHLRYVVKIAMSFRGYGLPILDVISEGNIGLMQAVKKFDPEKGFRLSTYAMWWIKASIQEYVLKSWSMVKIGTTAAQKKLFFNLRRMKNNLLKVDNNMLSPNDVKTIANQLSVSERDVLEMDSRLQSDASLNVPLGKDSADDAGEMLDFVESDGESQEVLLLESDDYSHKKALFHKALTELNEREKEIVYRRRLKEPAETLETLSQRFSISRERIRQIEVRAMEKLQAFVTSKAKDASPV
jgi:RNA polymerase sigma-32 factor